MTDFLRIFFHPNLPFFDVKESFQTYKVHFEFFRPGICSENSFFKALIF